MQILYEQYINCASHDLNKLLKGKNLSQEKSFKEKSEGFPLQIKVTLGTSSSFSRVKIGKYQSHIQNPVKHSRWSFLQKCLKAKILQIIF